MEAPGISTRLALFVLFGLYFSFFASLLLLLLLLQFRDLVECQSLFENIHSQRQPKNA